MIYIVYVTVCACVSVSHTIVKCKAIYNYHTQITRKRYSERGMKEEFAEITHILDWQKDEFHLLHPDMLDGWHICHQGSDKVCM